MVTGIEEVLQEKVTGPRVPESPKEPVRAMAAQMREVEWSHTQKTVFS